MDAAGDSVIPVYGFLEGDTLGILLLAQEEESIAALAERLQVSSSVRVAHRARVVVVLGGRTLDPRLTVRNAGLRALDRIDVRAAPEER